MNLLSLPSDTDASRKEKKWTEFLNTKYNVKITKNIKNKESTNSIISSWSSSKVSRTATQ